MRCSPWLCRVPGPQAPPLPAPPTHLRAHPPPLCSIHQHFHLAEAIGPFHPLIIPLPFFFLLLVFTIFEFIALILMRVLEMRGDKRDEPTILNYEPNLPPDEDSRTQINNSVPTFSMGKKRSGLSGQTKKCTQALLHNLPCPTPRTLMHPDTS